MKTLKLSVDPVSAPKKTVGCVIPTVPFGAETGSRH